MRLSPQVSSYQRLRVEAYTTPAAMGTAAAAAVAARLRSLLSQQSQVRVAFAAAPSQAEFLTALAQAPDLDWSRVMAFHLDEYIGLPAGHPACFARWLDRHLFRQVPLGAVHYLTGTAADPQTECRRYAALLGQAPLDLACIGIGENGHLAFNDPHVADFADPLAVKVVDLAEASRRQQVHDGCFPDLPAVPRQAMTLTIPTIVAARALSVVVPGAHKAAAVRAALTGPVSPACPASALRGHPDAVLYLDQAAFSATTN